MECLIRSAVLVAAVASLVGCAESGAQTPPRTGQSQSAMTVSPIDTSTRVTSAPVASTDVGSPPPAAPSDPPVTTSADVPRDTTPRWTEGQILAITGAAASSDATEGRVAREKAHSARVSRFAETLILDQRDIAAQQAALARKYPGASSPTSTSIDSGRGDFVQSLKTSYGASFDRAFVDGQIRDSQAMLKLIDQELLPSARTPEIREFLHNLRSKTIAHLLAAQEIQVQIP
jgi:predicted outer membrane protein